jgi:ribosomal protein S18 acetylase RimI-like enzyme
MTQEILIKTYSSLNEYEKNLVFDLIKKIESTTLKSFSELDKNFTSVIFNKGDTLFSFWINGNVICTIGVVVKDIIYKGEIFITAINIRDEQLLNFSHLYNLLEKDLLERFNPKIIKLGIRNHIDILTKSLYDLSFDNPYYLYQMTFKANEFNSNILDSNFYMENLDNSNKNTYMHINNDSFSNSPNGGSLSIEDLYILIESYKTNPNLIGIFKHKDIPVGIFELTIDNNIGTIEAIGISNNYQKKGFGKNLLYHVINRLKSNGANKIQLNVISINEVAYNIYLKQGFKKDKVLSKWFVKNIIT